MTHAILQGKLRTGDPHVGSAEGKTHHIRMWCGVVSVVVGIWAWQAPAAWHENPTVKATVDVGYAGMTDPHFLAKSSDGQYIGVPLNYNTSAPFKIWKVSTLLGKSGPVSDCACHSQSADGLSGSTWKGCAISSSLQYAVPATGNGSSYTSALKLDASPWALGTTAFTIKFGDKTTDAIAFGSDGKSLYSNDMSARGSIHKWTFDSIGQEQVLNNAKTFAETGISRIRNLSLYTMGDRDVLYFGEGDASAGTKGQVKYIDTSATTWTAGTIVTTALAGDIMNVKLAGMASGAPVLYVATDAGEIAVYTLAADGVSGATLVKTFVAADTARFCGLSQTPTAMKFRNFEVTDDGSAAFFMYGTNDDCHNPDDKTKLTVVSQMGYADSSVLFHLPLDSNFKNIANVSGQTESATVFVDTDNNGSATFVSDTLGETSVGKSPLHFNGGSLLLQRARVFIDITDFSLDGNVKAATFELMFKADSATVGDWGAIAFIKDFDPSELAILKSGDVPYCFLVQHYKADKALYCRTDTPGVSETTHDYVKKNTFDDKWHSLVITIDSSGSSTVGHGYVDGVEIERWTNKTDKNWRGVTPASGKRLYLGLGTKGTSRIAFDEIRVSKGVLPSYKWLKQETVPAEGEALLYLPFEGNLNTIVHADNGPAKLSGDPVYSSEPWRNTVVEHGSKNFVKDNGQCLMVTDSISFSVPYWALNRWTLNEVTIEYFIKGVQGGNYNAWSSPVRIGKQTGADFGEVFPYMVQLSNDTKYYLRADGYSDEWHGQTVDTSLGTAFADGKWHHVAMTAKAEADGTTTISHYFDYQLKRSAKTDASNPWHGFDPAKNALIFDKSGNSPFYIDEFRISKGAIDPSKFLQARNAGLILLFR